MPLRNWSDYLKKHLFKNQGGFFELPYVSNSPQLMVESIAAIPVSNHRPQEQEIFTDTAYTTGSLRYKKLEDGLWLLGTSLHVKQNIVSTAVYDGSTKSEYYFLSFAVFKYRFPLDGTGKEYTTLISTTCTFYKPNTEVNSFFYAGSRGRFFNIIFTKEWALKQLCMQGEMMKEVAQYLDGESGFVNWIDIVPDAINLSEVLWEKLDHANTATPNSNELKAQLINIVRDFFEGAYADKRIKDHVTLHNPDYANVARAEQIILGSTGGPFVGVDKIAKAVNVSPTKLKTIFKSVFGFSMLQYNKEKNMLLAKQLLQRSNLQVKHIASVAGYKSSSKFAASFKKRFNVLPTDVPREATLPEG